MSLLRVHLDAVAEKLAVLSNELQRHAEQERAGSERPDLQELTAWAMPWLSMRWTALKHLLATGAPDADVATILLAFDRDVSTLICILQDKMQIIPPGQSLN
jgi:hypothetical protein